MVALRLGNPGKCKLFDRCTRNEVNEAGVKGITSQSTALKYKSFGNFLKLGSFLCGDLVELETLGRLNVPRDSDQPCRFYFHIKSFYMQGPVYMADGDIFIQSSFSGLEDNLAIFQGQDCFVRIEHLRSRKYELEDLKFGKTKRAVNITPAYSSYAYDNANPASLIRMSMAEYTQLDNRLASSIQNGAVQVPLNLHLDDASMVTTKMWKSASVVTIQIAGAPKGYKGGESNNMILALTPTTKISLKRLFDTMTEDLRDLQNDGFDAFDFFSGEVVKVKLPIACVLGDLPAKGEVTPFKGFRADVFCSRDLYNKRTQAGFDIKRDKHTLQNQINEIKNEPLLGEKKRLGVKYGLDHNNLDTVLSEITKFDLTKDLPADVLHHYLLGWMKKTLILLKTDHLTKPIQDELCMMVDQIILWKEYSPRTTSSAFKSIASNIGRNIKALLQVIWYPIYLIIGFNPAANRDLEAIVRTIFYLSKIGYMLFNSGTIVWTPFIIRVFNNAITQVVSFFGRRMESILEGPKSHDLRYHLVEDLVRHGNPAGYDCSPGESKMRVQKLKNTFSNKSAPSVDTATKVMKTEIIRHIMEGGVLNADGTLCAHPNVLTEARRFRSFRIILGTEDSSITPGTVSLYDYDVVNRRKIKRKQQPPQQHVDLGISNTRMMTCKRIMTDSGPLFRDSGFYYKKVDGSLELCMLTQIYNSDEGFTAVAEILDDWSRNFPDPFLQEMELRVWKRTGRFLLLDQFIEVKFSYISIYSLYMDIILTV